jgi:hypothetical protein
MSPHEQRDHMSEWRFVGTCPDLRGPAPDVSSAKQPKNFQGGSSSLLV